MTRPTIMINEVTVPQINAAFLGLNNGLASLSSDLDSDLSRLEKAYKEGDKYLQQEIDKIVAGTMVYSAGDNINISSTGVISALVYNGTLTINRNGTSLGTFSANQQGSSSVDIIVPTKTSDLNNDSGFITSASIPTNISAFNNDVGYITSSDSITGNAATATNATNDSDGNAINTTYAKKTELSTNGYTFIVYDSTTWSQFMGQSSSYNFARTLIKAGDWTLSSKITLPAGAIIDGETGTNITITTDTINSWEGVYHASVRIRNINFIKNYTLTGTRTYRCFTSCIFENCTFVLSSNAVTASGNNNGGFFYDSDIMDCTIRHSGSYRLFDFRWGDRIYGRYKNNRFIISNAEALSTGLGYSSSSQTVVFANNSFELYYTLTADYASTVMVSYSGQASRPCYQGNVFYIQASGTGTLTVNFGDSALFNNYFKTYSASQTININHGTGPVANNISNGGLIWT